MELNNNIDLLRKETILHGNYRVDGYLASGGFGNTYVVTHTELEETFAIKEFYMKGVSERCDDSSTVRVSNTQNRNQFESQRRKFKKEALRLRKLHDPHIVRVHDLFEENGTAYYVMDFIDGMSLSAYLKQKGKPLTEEQIWDILPQILQALDTVHTSGFQHLDLKPANIMINRNGSITLIDFGASKQLDMAGGNSTSSTLAYTPGYAPREQMEQNITKLGPWTDLYALGATLYNLISNKVPPLPSDIDDEHERAFTFPKQISDKMRALILWMMMPKRDLRPQSVLQVREQLEKKEPISVHYGLPEITVFDQNESYQPTPQPSPSPSPEPSPEPSQKWYIQYRVVLAAAILLGVALIGWAIYENTDRQTQGIVQAESTSDTIKNVNEPEPTKPAVPTEVNHVQYFNDVMKQYFYTGPVDNEQKPHGKGKAILANGDTYEGDFVHGVFQGEATYHFAAGDKFVGTFTNNKFSEGTYTIDDGTHFVGTFKDGQPDQGTWYDAKGNKL